MTVNSKKVIYLYLHLSTHQCVNHAILLYISRRLTLEPRSPGSPSDPAAPTIPYIAKQIHAR
jgi:hypothetical protein